MSSNEPKEEETVVGLGRGLGLVIILHAWSWCLGGWFAVQASASDMCKCADVVATNNFCEGKNNMAHHPPPTHSKHVRLSPIPDPFLCPTPVLFS